MNLKKRIDVHNTGRYRSWTRNKGPWKLFYCEEYTTRREAEVREKFFKSKQGWFFLKKLRDEKL